MFDREAIEAAGRLRVVLQERDLKIVFAESCTAGRIAATLAAFAGISRHLCGSFVVYRNASKADWLGVDTRLLEDPAIGPVSPAVSQQLAQSSLNHTYEADLAFAITGEIGPGAPDHQDGRVHCCMAMRTGQSNRAWSFQLSQPAPSDSADIAGRIRRLDEATAVALSGLRAAPH
jgi:nicotinamide-nucleotide amidase